MSDVRSVRPKSATVLGILNIVFSGFGILSGLISIIIFSFVNTIFENLLYELPSEFFWMIQLFNPYFTSIAILTIIQILSYELGLGSGVTLLKENGKAVLVSNLYAGHTIAISLASYFLSLRFVQRFLGNAELLSNLSYEDRFMVNLIRSLVPGIAGVIGILFSSAYPALMLILLNRRHWREYSTKHAPSGH